MKPAKEVISHKIQVGVDDHVFIMIERPDRPTISLDFMNAHGRGVLSVRSDGCGIGSLVCDVKWIDPKSNLPLARYCPMCGEKLNLCSSFSHSCKDEFLKKYRVLGGVVLSFIIGDTRTECAIGPNHGGILEVDDRTIYFSQQSRRIASVTPVSYIEEWLKIKSIEAI